MQKPEIINLILLDALYRALPFVEDALEDECYKKESVLSALQYIKRAIKKAEE